MNFVLKVEDQKIIIPDKIYSKFYDLSDENKDRVIKVFNSYKPILEKIISMSDNGEIIVNWEKRKKIIDKEDYRTRSATEKYTNFVLASLGILAFNKEGAWSFSDEEMNPPWGIIHEFDQWDMGTLYFVREKDIFGYAQANRIKSPYRWYL